MKKSKQNLGFTIAELIVALSVSVIALAMASVLLVGLFNAFNKSTAQSQQTNDLKMLKSDVVCFVEDAIKNEFSVYLSSEFSENLVFKKDGSSNKVLQFNENNLLIDGNVKDSFKQVKQMKFALVNQLIVCKTTFLDETEITFIV